MKGLIAMREKSDLIKIYLLFFAIFTLIILTSTMCIETLNGILAIIIACIWMIASILYYLFYLRKNTNILAVIIYAIINALISGVSISAYYSLKNVNPYKTEWVILIFALVLTVNLCISLIIRKRIVFTVINLALTILSLCIAGYIWIDKDKSAGSSLFFMLIVYLCFGIAQFIVEKHSQSWMKLISLSTLIMFSGILLVVLIAVSEGDVLDGLDIVLDGTSLRKRKK